MYKTITTEVEVDVDLGDFPHVGLGDGASGH